MANKRKWFHAIGASGKATANVARMFKKMGWFVTGSDAQFIPPASEIITKSRIPFELGYSYEHLTRAFWETKLETQLDVNDVPDLGLIVESASSKNKELLFALKKNIPIKPYSQILGEYLVKPESIVVIGTAGKTTTTALLVTLMNTLGLNPSYMIGADVVGLKEGLLNTDSKWSVLEGDEYYNPQLSAGAKFLQYKPKYLVITKISWEHQDIFQTEASYVEEFKKCVDLIPENGLIIAKYGDKNIDYVLTNAKCRIIRYGLKENVERFENADDDSDSKVNAKMSGCWTIEEDLNGNEKIFDDKGNKIFEFATPLLGDYNLENILASVALLFNVTPIENIKLLQSSIEEFQGVKKRLEFLYKSDEIVVVDDFGIAPERAKISLKTVKKYFPEHHIIAIFEPNAGSRPRDLEVFNKIYDHAFNNADEVIIPDLSTGNPDLVTHTELVERLRSFEVNASHTPSEELETVIAAKVQEFITQNKKVVLIFFSSYRLTTIAENVAQSVKVLVKNFSRH